MEIAVNGLSDMVIEEKEIVTQSNNNFIGANTVKVSLQHLKEDCIIPVFSKDNETTISHYQFIKQTYEAIKELLPEFVPKTPEIRVSHVVKGRIPGAIGKPVKELLEHEKTIYYERCAFVIELSNFQEIVNGNALSLTIGGVRAYNQENLYSKKTLEKFKVFIGYQNKVCTNLCVSTDGLANTIKIGSISEMHMQIQALLMDYNRAGHLESLKRMYQYSLSENQFAHLLGKIRMYPHMSKDEQRGIFPVHLTDSQLNHVLKDYYTCKNFRRDTDKQINLWNLYNLFTEANKSSYIDNYLERSVNAYEFIDNLGSSIAEKTPNWYLNN